MFYSVRKTSNICGTSSGVPYLQCAYHWDVSFTAKQNGKTVSFYLLGEQKLSAALAAKNALSHEDLSRYDLMCGIEGIALGVIPDFRKTGLTEQLKQQVKTIPDVDFIYGMQLNRWVIWITGCAPGD